jgi:hypothetical protein
MPVALNVDGIERQRKKWNRLAKAWYLISEWLATFCPTVVVTDAAHHRRTTIASATAKSSVFIPYGADTGKLSEGSGVLAEIGAGAGPLFPLREPYGAREPSRWRCARRSSRTRTPMKLALVGDAPYARGLYPPCARNRGTRASSSPARSTATGYRELGSHCFAYIHATEVGGTHPALIEAMGRGALVLYRNTPENEEVAGGVGIPFEPDELTAKMEQALAMGEEERAALREKAMARVRERYSWDAVTGEYERLLRGMASARGAATAL